MAQDLFLLGWDSSTPQIIIYDVGTKQMSLGPSDPDGPCHSFTMGIFNGAIFIAGGQTYANQLLSPVWKLEATRGSVRLPYQAATSIPTWERVLRLMADGGFALETTHRMFSARSGFTMAQHGDKMATTLEDKGSIIAAPMAPRASGTVHSSRRRVPKTDGLSRTL